MTLRFSKLMLLACASVGLMFGQQPAAPPPAGGSPVAKQPRPKSQKEVDALQAMFAAKDPDGRIAAAKNLLTQFADTEFKTLAYTMIAMGYQQKNDQENMMAAYEEVLKVDPKNFGAMIEIANVLAARTREFDLDKEEKLGRAEKLAIQAQQEIKTAPRPQPQVTDEQWNGAKKEFNGRALEALGMIALARKKYDVAITNMKAALETSSQPDPATMVRLANVYNLSNKPDDAIALLDKVLAMPELHPAIKQFAQAEKVKSGQLKARSAAPGAAAPKAPAAPPAPAAAPKP